MASLRFTTHLMRHRPVRALEASGDTVGAVIEAALADDPMLRSYVLDDQGRARKHIAIYLDGQPIRDKQRLSDACGPGAEIYVMQALSGG